jgi:hypothetical protein
MMMGQNQTSANWKRASLCAGNGACVEVATNLPGGRVGVRDSKNLQAGEVLQFSPGAWSGFVADVVAGHFAAS